MASMMKRRVMVTVVLTTAVFIGVGLVVHSIDRDAVGHVLPSAVLASIVAALIAWRWTKDQN
jgi:hypothetical protein